MFTQNFMKVSAAVRELSCPQTFCPISQWWNNQFCDLDLWPMTLKFSVCVCVCSLLLLFKLLFFAVNDFYNIYHFVCCVSSEVLHVYRHYQSFILLVGLDLGMSRPGSDFIWW